MAEKERKAESEKDYSELSALGLMKEALRLYDAECREAIASGVDGVSGGTKREICAFDAFCGRAGYKSLAVLPLWAKPNKDGNLE